MAVVLHYRVSGPVSGFNIDTSSPKTFENNADWFGYKVVQFNENSGSKGIIVSAPLEKDSNGQRNGNIYSCNYLSQQGCRKINLPPNNEKTGWSMGLSLATDPTNSKLLACGPTYSHECGKNMYLNGVCFQVDNRFSFSGNITPGYQECSSAGIDIVFLVDGSGSVDGNDFVKMKDFMKNIIRKFIDRNTQFAVVQFSTYYRLEFNFKRIKSSQDINNAVSRIQQSGGWTSTPSGIKYVAESVFVPSQGARSDAVKVLITVTDGQSNDRRVTFSEAIAAADRKKIIRYAIGVGDAFHDYNAKQELATIASSPDTEYVFQVNNFDALNGIQDQIQEKIFTIEGTQQSSLLSSFQLEMSEGGFSALFRDNAVVFGAVGMYDWSGGLFEFVGQENPTFINMSSQATDMKDAYLGYSFQTAKRGGNLFYVVGAPRFQHRGKVIIFSKKRNGWQRTAEVEGAQIGSYFGAELCTVDLDKDQHSDLILIGVPMYHDEGVGGIVKVCTLNSLGTLSCGDELRGEKGHPFARFGASIAEIKDLNGDGFSDVAVGAPMENDQQGTVYIFHGRKRGVLMTYSQKIEGTQVSPGIKYFGQSIQGSMDITQDGITDLAVGAFGKALVLRSRPVLDVETQIRFNPETIPVAQLECSNSDSKNTVNSQVTICFTIKKRTQDNIRDLSASLTYSLQLDAIRTKKRATFENNNENINGTFTVHVENKCVDHVVKILVCIEDSFTPIRMDLTFSLSGNPIASANNLRPILNKDSRTQLTGLVQFEKDCGPDNICEDHLKLSFNFSSFQTLVVGSSPVLNLTVSFENLGEDSYNTKVIFFHPSSLSYRRVTMLQSYKNRKISIRCNPSISLDDDATRTCPCDINHPVFRSKSKILFIATFDVSADKPWQDTLRIQANSTSDNTKQIKSDRAHQEDIPVQFAVDITATKVEESTRYINFSSKEEKMKKPVVHTYKVENLHQRRLPVNVTFSFPVKIGSTLVWSASDVTARTVGECRFVKETPGNPGSLVQELKRKPTLDCKTAVCRVIQCSMGLLNTSQPLYFDIKGDVSSNWIKQTKQTKLSLASSASLEYDQNKYVHIYPDKDKFLNAKVETDIEIFEEYNYIPIIIGSSVGGLALLALITAVLYKVGFFKRQYKNMLDGAHEGDTAAPSAEE
ncbi:integrin alpha-X [Latimeria chalumnae]|uniref:integrin alpha-X n=1 Tax=Latimeria chalumnae TaxID=7897 RepID=UPI00313C67EF